MLDQWVDVHAHFSPPTDEASWAARWADLQAKGWTGPRPPQWDAGRVIAYMDEAGVAMQMLSNVPKSLDALRASNDFGASMVARHPSRFGLLAALPTDDPAAALAEIERAGDGLRADGFAVTCCYNGVHLGDASLEPVWAELNRRGAAVFAHPDAYASASLGRPAAILEVAFETARTVVDMLYAGVFRRHPQVRLVLAHCGAALPALSGRLLLLGTEPWVPNPNKLTPDEMRAHLASLYLDTAATGSAHTLRPALEMTTCDHIVYGSDCGVPCTTVATMRANLDALLGFCGLTPEQIEAIGHNALRLFPAAAARMAAVVPAKQLPTKRLADGVSI